LGCLALLLVPEKKKITLNNSHTRISALSSHGNTVIQFQSKKKTRRNLFTTSHTAMSTDHYINIWYVEPNTCAEVGDSKENKYGILEKRKVQHFCKGIPCLL